MTRRAWSRDVVNVIIQLVGRLAPCLVSSRLPSVKVSLVVSVVSICFISRNLTPCRSTGVHDL